MLSRDSSTYHLRNWRCGRERTAEMNHCVVRVGMEYVWAECWMRRVAVRSEKKMDKIKINPHNEMVAGVYYIYHGKIIKTTINHMWALFVFRIRICFSFPTVVKTLNRSTECPKHVWMRIECVFCICSKCSQRRTMCNLLSLGLLFLSTTRRRARDAEKNHFIGGLVNFFVETDACVRKHTHTETYSLCAHTFAIYYITDSTFAISRGL